jgi:hypothetical protein
MSKLPESLESAVVRVLNNTQAGGSGMSVEYYLTEGKKSVRYQGACFSGFASHMKEGKFDPNKTTLTYLPPEFPSSRIKLYRRWVELCQTVGVVPKTQSVEDIMNNGLKINIGDPKLSPFGFYLQCCFLRYIKEVPRLVENVVDLVNNGADFWAAFAFCHDHNVGYNCGHSISPSGAYGGGAKGMLSLATSLHRHVRGKVTLDDRVLSTSISNLQNPTIYSNVPWQIHARVRNLAFEGKSIHPSHTKQVLNPKLIRVFLSDTKEEFEETLQNFKEENPDVVFA